MRNLYWPERGVLPFVGLLPVGPSSFVPTVFSLLQVESLLGPDFPLCLVALLIIKYCLTHSFHCSCPCATPLCWFKRLPLNTPPSLTRGLSAHIFVPHCFSERGVWILTSLPFRLKGFRPPCPDKFFSTYISITCHRFFFYVRLLSSDHLP